MINSEDLPTYFESNGPQAEVRYDNKQLKAELDSLRQENSRLRKALELISNKGTTIMADAEYARIVLNQPPKRS